jgi:CHASE2 domain-containing sensor protein
MAYAFILAITAILLILPAINNLNHFFLDKQFNVINKLYQPELAKDVVIIGIDEEAARRYREPLALWHSHLGRVFEALALSKPKAVVILVTGEKLNFLVL